jgi:hypothetical protein
MGQPAHEAPETSVGRQSSLGVDLGIPLGDGQQKPPVQREQDHGLEVNIEGNNANLNRVDTSGDGKDVKLGDDGKPLPQDDDPNKKPPEEGDEKAPEAGPLGDLPDFDAAKPETVQAYEKAFVNPDGKSFNLPNLSADWQKNLKVDAKTGEFSGNLSENTYKFLETKGIDRETVRAVEAGQIARIKMDRAEVFSMAGGQEKYLAAVEWARKGGLDAAATKKFNEDLNAGGALRKDAVDLLMMRHSRANPQGRRATPQRTTGANASVGNGEPSGAKPYTNYAEYQADLRAARKSNDQAKLNESRARLRASPWYSGNQK